MLSYIELVNFKSFRKNIFDLRGSYGEPKRIALVYGENGSGKTNLIQTLLFVSQTLRTLNDQERLSRLSEMNISDEDIISTSEIRVALDIVRNQFYDVSGLITEYKTIGENENMSVKIGFRIDNRDGFYYMEFSDNAIIKEQLRYSLTERAGDHFLIENGRAVLSPSIFIDAAYRKELHESISKYWGKHTFLSIFYGDYKRINREYLKSRVSQNFYKVFTWIQRFSIMSNSSRGENNIFSAPFHFLFNLQKGILEDKNEPQLKGFEAALDTFFTQLYSDIKKVYYVFTPEKDSFKYELYIRKLIGGKELEIPFALESTGTKKLASIFPAIFTSVVGASVFIDEIDSGVHDLLMEKLLGIVAESLMGQFIATTHNTLLLEYFKPEDIYIIKMDADGNKAIESLADSEKRTQLCNSIRKKYLRGDYGGVPYVGSMNFSEIVLEALECIKSQSHDVGGEDE